MLKYETLEYRMEEKEIDDRDRTASADSVTPDQLRLWVTDMPELESELGVVYDAEPMEGIFPEKVMEGQCGITEKDRGALRIPHLLVPGAQGDRGRRIRRF